MIIPPGPLKVLVAVKPVDFRKGMVGLASLVLTVGAVWLATNNPVVFIVLLVITVVLMWIVTWMLFKFLRAVFRRARSFFTATA